MCLYPKLIKNKKYVSNKKNGGNIPMVQDERVLLVPVGCGKCIECMKQKKRQWQVRMSEEIKVNKNGKFVTLTFSNDSLIELRKELPVKLDKIPENELATLAVRRFLERWRKKYKKSVRHWLVTELGHEGTERIHLHGIIFTDNVEDIDNIWQYGMVWVGEYVNSKTINYIVKYVNKPDEKHKGYTPKVLCSKGIGSNYINNRSKIYNKFNNENTREFYKTSDGNKLNLPIYYRNKLYNDEEREKLWLNKLDENVRWVCCEKVNADDDEAYASLLEFYREKNRRLGYGDDSVDWSAKAYKSKLNLLRKNKYVKVTKEKDDIKNNRNNLAADLKPNTNF